MRFPLFHFECVCMCNGWKRFKNVCSWIFNALSHAFWIRNTFTRLMTFGIVNKSHTWCAMRFELHLANCRYPEICALLLRFCCCFVRREMVQEMASTNCQYDRCKSNVHKMICMLCFFFAIEISESSTWLSHKFCHLFSFFMRTHL